MTGPVYEAALSRRGMERLIPGDEVRLALDRLIFDELCRGLFTADATRTFLAAIEAMKARGAQCVILGCTEIPIIVTAGNSPLPVLDSTRLLGRAAARLAADGKPLRASGGWVSAG
jgi:aspartate racemase